MTGLVERSHSIVYWQSNYHWFLTRLRYNWPPRYLLNSLWHFSLSNWPNDSAKYTFWCFFSMKPIRKVFQHDPAFPSSLTTSTDYWLHASCHWPSSVVCFRAMAWIAGLGTRLPPHSGVSSFGHFWYPFMMGLDLWTFSLLYRTFISSSLSRPCSHYTSPPCPCRSFQAQGANQNVVRLMLLCQFFPLLAGSHKLYWEHCPSF